MRITSGLLRMIFSPSKPIPSVRWSSAAISSTGDSKNATCTQRRQRDGAFDSQSVIGRSTPPPTFSRPCVKPPARNPSDRAVQHQVREKCERDRNDLEGVIIRRDVRIVFRHACSYFVLSEYCSAPQSFHPNQCAPAAVSCIIFSASSRVKVLGFWTGGKSLNVAAHCAASSCAPYRTGMWSINQS